MSKNRLSRRDFLKAMAAGSAAALTSPIAPLINTVAAQDETTYHEAPMLTDLVNSGDLPPVADRIPKNPRVITPYDEIGQYGGTWHRAFKGLSDRWGPNKLQEEFMLEWYAPDPDSLTIEPNYISEWTQNEDATEFTFTLREGLKWSDGASFTTEDVQFGYDLMAMDPPVINPPSIIVSSGELMDLKLSMNSPGRLPSSRRTHCCRLPLPGILSVV
jgi:peptide/nickel transport system substrate-binding protein